MQAEPGDEQLPTEWWRKKTRTGKVFYEHKTTRNIQYEFPGPETKKPQPEPEPQPEPQSVPEPRPDPERTRREGTDSSVRAELERLQATQASAMEDPYQDEVPECITAFRDEGYRIMMVTGDSDAAAENIAYAT